MKNLIMRLLQSMARRQIARFQPVVIAVTGSVGKTSTKNALAIVLETAYDVRSAKKNYNNEFGVPLAIMGEASPGKYAWAWLKLFVRQSLVKTFPKYLVLEYGADKPGDIQASCTIASPHIGVITAVSPVHAANYPNLGALAEEKSVLAKNVPVDGVVVLNADDATVMLMRQKCVAPVATYGFAGSEARILKITTKTFLHDTFEGDDVVALTTAMLEIRGETVTIELKNCLGDAVVSACVAALLVGRYCEVRLRKAAAALSEKMVAAPGRMKPLMGIKGALILDDSYNAAPASMMAALEVLQRFHVDQPASRRMAVLGKMAELGQYSISEHSALGQRVAEVADIFVAVGEEMHDAADAAVRAGMKSEAIFRFTDAVQAGRWLDKNIRAGDIVLVKGSQSARMEKAVKDVVADPLRASEFLCRQEEYWLTH